MTFSIFQSYQENGFYVAKNIIPREAIEDVKKSILYILNDQLQRLSLSKEENHYFALKNLFDHDLTRYLSTLRVLTNLKSMYDLFFRSEIQETLEALHLTLPIIPTGPAFHIVSPTLKPEGGYSGFAPHQDWTSMQGSLDSLIVWIPFSSINSHFFPIDIIPSSHLKGLLSGEIQEFVYEVGSEHYRESDFVPLELECGDAVFFSSFTVHRTSTHGPKNNVRLAASLRFENATEKTFADRLYPCAYKRVVNRQLIHESFPTINDLKPIFPKAGIFKNSGNGGGALTR